MPQQRESINDKLDLLRDALNNALKEDGNLQSTEILKLSERLDEIINQYIVSVKEK